MNKSLKTTTTIIFLPFFRAILVGNVLFWMVLMFGDDGYTAEFMYYFMDRNSITIFVLWNGFIVWTLFYLAVAVIFKEGRRFDSLLDISKMLKVTALFGLSSLVYSFLDQSDYASWIYLLGLLYGFYILFLFTLIIFETAYLGLLVEKNKNCSRFKAQLLSFSLFLFLPFIVTYLARFLFMTIHLGGA
ncbi:MAG: hypothetical protein KAS88_01085 [Deltaproteobacteria bacterium]|nr:hypothetical protein [Deltaproteobacteria bacterium]